MPVRQDLKNYRQKNECDPHLNEDDLEGIPDPEQGPIDEQAV